MDTSLGDMRMRILPSLQSVSCYVTMAAFWMHVTAHVSVRPSGLAETAQVGTCASIRALVGLPLRKSQGKQL